uniref:Lysosomal trafficking regulator lyst n=1 Tax=Dracunculus medinensis TaxID=318479 RepID=A0A0N4U6N5_DRAME
LTLNEFVMKSLKECSSTIQETMILRNLLDYVVGIKCKYVQDEAAFLFVIHTLQELIIRQYNFSLRQANDFLSRYIEWLLAVRSDDKQTSLLSIIGFRFVCHIMELYLSQQIISTDHSPRTTVNAPVINSRIHAFRELSLNKNYSPYQGVLSLAEVFFTNVSTYNFLHANDLLKNISIALYQERFFRCE